MYFPYFMSYMLLGIVLAAVVLVWAMRNGQFKDQQRARYLPLESDDRLQSVGSTRRAHRLEIYGLIFLAAAGLAASAAVLVFSLILDAS